MLAGYWLEIHCRCRLTYTPMGRLAERAGANVRLGEVVGRLRCKRCGERPKEVALVDDPATGASGRRQVRIVLTGGYAKAPGGRRGLRVLWSVGSSARNGCNDPNDPEQAADNREGGGFPDKPHESIKAAPESGDGLTSKQDLRDGFERHEDAHQYEDCEQNLHGEAPVMSL
jgi:hypothetical protein